MDREIIKKLSILVEHWIEHSREHAAEYEKWGRRAKEAALGDAGVAITQAGEALKKSEVHLRDALNFLLSHQADAGS
jgi:hypothetical protein